jgi:hypothetical protein
MPLTVLALCLARDPLILLKYLSVLFVQPFNRFDPHSYKVDHALTPVEECQVTGRNTHVEIPQAAVAVQTATTGVRPGTDTAQV